MKCTWPTKTICVGDPTQPIFDWLAFGFCVGSNANFMFRVGRNASLSVFSYQYQLNLPLLKNHILIDRVLFGYLLI